MVISMPFPMFGVVIKEHEIFWSVIQRVFVYMMHNFMLLKFSTNNFLHNKSMFKASNCNNSIVFFYVAVYSNIYKRFMFKSGRISDISTTFPLRMIWTKILSYMGKAHFKSGFFGRFPIGSPISSKAFRGTEMPLNLLQVSWGPLEGFLTKEADRFGQSNHGFYHNTLNESLVDIL